MLFTTPTQFAVLAICLIAGWLLGLASAPGGKKWKERLRTEEAEHRATREGLTTRDARIRDLERERDDALRHRGTAAAPVAASAAAGAAAGSTTAHHHRGVGGFFGWGRDNLSRIRGIDEVLEKRLNADGIKTYAAIESLTPAEETAIEDRLGMGHGRIQQEQWREQAAMLREGHDEDHGRRFV